MTKTGSTTGTFATRTTIGTTAFNATCITTGSTSNTYICAYVPVAAAVSVAAAVFTSTANRISTSSILLSIRTACYTSVHAIILQYMSIFCCPSVVVAVITVVAGVAVAVVVRR